MHTEDGEILAVSDALVRLTGYPRASLRRMEDWVARAYEPDRAPEMLALAARHFTEDRPLDETEVEVRTANGDITVEHAVGSRVDATTSNGSIKVGDVIRGTAVLKTSMGDLEVGIREGTAARLDLSTGFGKVRNSLEEISSGPGKAAESAARRTAA